MYDKRIIYLHCYGNYYAVKITHQDDNSISGKFQSLYADGRWGPWVESGTFVDYRYLRYKPMMVDGEVWETPKYTVIDGPTNRIFTCDPPFEQETGIKTGRFTTSPFPYPILTNKKEWDKYPLRYDTDKIVRLRRYPTSPDDLDALWNNYGI